MNIKSKALRVIGTIFGVLFSIALVIAVIASLFLSITTNLTKPETIITFVRELNVVEKVLETDEVQQVLQEQGINTEVMDKFVESPFFQDTVEVYTDEIVAAIQGQPTDVVLSEDTLKRIAEEHMDSLVTLVRPHLPEEVQQETEKVEAAVNKVVEEYAPAVIEKLPSGEQIRETLIKSEIQKPAELLVNTSVPIVMYGIIGGLTVLVFVCMLHKFRGLLCLGIDALVAALLLLVPYLLIGDGSSITSLVPEVAGLIMPLITMLTAKLATYLIVLTVVGVLLIAGFITYRVVAKKKALVAAMAPQAQPLPAQEL